MGAYQNLKEWLSHIKYHKLKDKILDYLYFKKQYFTGYKKSKTIYDSPERKVLLLCTSVHPNLGDQAIGYAEKAFLSKNTKRKIIEVSVNQFYLYLKAIKKHITPDDVIIIHGGGNIGDQYMMCEKQRRIIIKSFPKNRIISFPQTLYFSDTKKGKKELIKAKKIYNSHPKLTMIAREEKTFELMKKYFPKCEVMFTPDIVMTLSLPEKTEKRNDILVCLREDVEKSINSADREKILSACKKTPYKTVITDTCLDFNFPLSQREQYLNEKWDQFYKAKLVITDRIHGMVFAAITNTPCIALGNYNHKVKSSYQWYKQLDYIEFAESVDDIDKKVEKLINKDDCKYDSEAYCKCFERILKLIK